MRRAVISPRILHGCILPPPSKSAAHRAIICASLAEGKCVLSPVNMSDDILATIEAMKTMGADIRFAEGRVTTGINARCENGSLKINCRESGSTLRFLIPVAAALGISAVFEGSGRLPKRPLKIYSDLLPAHGVFCKSAGGLPFSISGKLLPGIYRLPGNISSQFISGLMLALPLLNSDSEIIITTKEESSGYTRLTAEIMSEYGVKAVRTSAGWHISGNQRYKARDFKIERDWSQAAFWLAAGALGHGVCCGGLKSCSSQGDSEIAGILGRFGAEVATGGGRVIARKGTLNGIEIDASQIPDLVPVLAALGCAAGGDTRIINASRLRLKESDRLHTVNSALSAIGGSIEESEAGLLIHGECRLAGGQAESFGDHRIAMMLAVASCICENTVSIDGCDSVNKSYPDFFDDFNKLGGHADVIDLG